ncbi:MAG TPA: MarR family transcriptional regulator [Thermoleophilaceae bacterium]|nr:MarR family transcriptional regulator [Thermoleophilaceae bacterium]
MSSRLPKTSARSAPENLAILLREPLRSGTALLHQRFAEGGHPEIRPPHGNVMQFLDDDGTRVSVLAERASITKQSMAELVAHLEQLGYVERVPDPTDRRAKLVRATPRGKQLYSIARAVVAEIEAEWAKRLGKAKMRQLRELLEELNAGL